MSIKFIISSANFNPSSTSTASGINGSSAEYLVSIYYIPIHIIFERLLIYFPN